MRAVIIVRIHWPEAACSKSSTGNNPPEAVKIWMASTLALICICRYSMTARVNSSHSASKSARSRRKQLQAPCVCAPALPPSSMKLASVQGEPAKPSKGVPSPTPICQANGFIHILQAIGNALRVESSNVVPVPHDVIHFDAALFAESETLAQRFRHHQDVAEKNGRVELKPAHRLQGYYRGKIRNSDQLAERKFLFEGTVLRKATASLAHQPDGRAVHLLAVQCLDHSLCGSCFSWKCLEFP